MEYIEPSSASQTIRGAFKLTSVEVDQIVKALEQVIPLGEEERILKVKILKADRIKVVCDLDELDRISIHFKDFQSVEFDCSARRKSASVRFDAKDGGATIFCYLDRADSNRGIVEPAVLAAKNWYSFMYTMQAFSIRTFLFGVMCGAPFFVGISIVKWHSIAAVLAYVIYCTLVILLLMYKSFLPPLYFDFGTIGSEFRNRRLSRGILFATVCFLGVAAAGTVGFLNSALDLKQRLQPKSEESAGPKQPKA